MKRILLILGVIMALAATCGAAAVEEQPITIKSNELQADQKSRTATFLGKVVAKQDDITIHADKLVVRYAEGGGEVEKVEAFGNVSIVQENRIGTAQHAVYFNKEGKITLTGSPKVLQGKDMVTGREITYYVNEDKSVVTGGPETRVEAVIFPKGKGKNDAKKP
jgi:lipopolysaccharide export system protein LptA